MSTTLFAEAPAPTVSKGEAAELSKLHDAIAPYAAADEETIPAPVIEGAHEVLQTSDLQGAVNALLAMIVAAQGASAVADLALQAARQRKQEADELVKCLEDRMVQVLDDTGCPGAFTSHHAVTLRTGTPGVRITDKAQIPGDYLLPQKPAPEREPDKAKIGKALRDAKKAAAKGGVALTIPGAELTNGSPSLSWINKGA